MTHDVVLVDAQDRPIGVCGKRDAHLGNGRLHRAFSVHLIDSSGRHLVQRRAAGKMLWPGFWSNACCSHPAPGETILGGRFLMNPGGKGANQAVAAARLGGRMTLMGNVAPLDIGVRGTPDEVEAATLDVLRRADGHPLILSVGGGVSPGMPAANIRAMSKALVAFEGERMD